MTNSDGETEVPAANQGEWNRLDGEIQAARITRDDLQGDVDGFTHMLEMKKEEQRNNEQARREAAAQEALQRELDA